MSSNNQSNKNQSKSQSLCNLKTIPSPKEIVSYLDKYVIGQKEAKKTLANASYLHEVRDLLYSYYNRDDFYKKSTVLLIGPTGCGKTFLVQKLSKVVNREMFTISAKDITPEGYKGSNMSSYIASFATQLNDPKQLEHSIIFIDELDKLCNNDEGLGQQVQHQLLKTIEGNEYQIDKDTFIDTTSIMFIFGGSFQHMRDAQKEVKNNVGFTPVKNDNDDTQEPYQKQLINHGIVRELAGRITTISELHELDINDMKSIMHVTDGVVSQYKEILDAIGVNHKLTKKRLNSIAETCLNRGTGARGIQSEVENYLKDIIFKNAGSIDEKSFVPENEIEQAELQKEQDDNESTETTETNSPYKVVRYEFSPDRNLVEKHKKAADDSRKTFKDDNIEDEALKWSVGPDFYNAFEDFEGDDSDLLDNIDHNTAFLFYPGEYWRTRSGDLVRINSVHETYIEATIYNNLQFNNVTSVYYTRDGFNKHGMVKLDLIRRVNL